MVGCFGVHGYLKVRPQTSSPDRFRSLRRVYLGPSAERAVETTIDDVVVRRGSVVLKLRMIGDRTAAVHSAGQYIFIEESDLAELPSGSYYVDDIIGCEAWTTDGEFIGTVEDVLKMPAQDVWAIRGRKELHLVPAVKEFIVSVGKGKIIVRTIEGLIEE